MRDRVESVPERDSRILIVHNSKFMKNSIVIESRTSYENLNLLSSFSKIVQWQVKVQVHRDLLNSSY